MVFHFLLCLQFCTPYSIFNNPYTLIQFKADTSKKFAYSHLSKFSNCVWLHTSQKTLNKKNVLFHLLDSLISSKESCHPHAKYGFQQNEVIFDKSQPPIVVRTHFMDMHMQTHTSLNQMQFRLECWRVNSYLNSWS